MKTQNLSEYQITYEVNGKTKTERIKAASWSEADEICKKKGRRINCQYIETSTDLLYLH